MPAITDILQYMRGQLFQTPQLPTQSFAGKTVVVTGANSGLGLECAKQLLARPSFGLTFASVTNQC